MAGDPTEPQQSVHVARVRDPQYRELYSNSNAVSLGPFDITVVFQKVSELVPGQGGITDLASVTMSPQNFKGFVRAAMEVLRAYENSFGQLSIPDQDTAPTRSASDMETAIQAARAAALAAQAKLSSTEQQPPSKRSRGASLKKAPEL